MDGMKLFGWLTLMISGKLDNIDIISRIEMEKYQFESTFPHHQKGTKKMYPAESPILSGFFGKRQIYRRLADKVQ